jgi:hypothetical protein
MSLLARAADLLHASPQFNSRSWLGTALFDTYYVAMMVPCDHEKYNARTVPCSAYAVRAIAQLLHVTLQQQQQQQQQQQLGNQPHADRAAEDAHCLAYHIRELVQYNAAAGWGQLPTGGDAWKQQQRRAGEAHARGALWERAHNQVDMRLSEAERIQVRSLQLSHAFSLHLAPHIMLRLQGIPQGVLHKCSHCPLGEAAQLMPGCDTA